MTLDEFLGEDIRKKVQHDEFLKKRRLPLREADDVVRCRRTLVPPQVFSQMAR